MDLEREKASPLKAMQFKLIILGRGLNMYSI
jgi:hypothetical protein